MYRNIIFKPINCHLNDFNLLNDCDPFLAAAIADNLFPTVLLKIIGGLEQKIKEMAWQLANIDLTFRRNMLFNPQSKDSFKYKDSLQYSDVDFLCKTAISMCTQKTQHNSKKITENANFYKDSFILLNNKFNSLSYIHTAFTSHWKCFTDDAFICALKANDESKIKKNITKFPLKDLLDLSIKSRHSFAHNSYSFQSRFSSLERASKATHPENYFMYFFVLVYIDLCLMHYAKIILDSYKTHA